MATERLLGVSDISRELGVPVPTVSAWYQRETRYLPKPSFIGPNDAPLWKRSRLEKWPAYPGNRVSVTPAE